MALEPSAEQRRLDRMASIMWSRDLLAQPENWCIIDTETTGLNPVFSRVVEITVLNGRGELILNTLVNPGVPIPAEVAAIHGISDVSVVDAPVIGTVWPELISAIQGKLVLAYNSAYDRAILENEARRHGLIEITSNWDCVMMKYSAFVGKWSQRFGNYQYQKLPSAGHRAHLDCKVTLDLLHQMGGTEC